jgi:DNA-binding Lrp family transcriptional regulator
MRRGILAYAARSLGRRPFFFPCFIRELFESSIAVAEVSVSVSDRLSPHVLPSFGGAVDILALLQGAPEEPRDAAFEANLVKSWQRDLPLDPEPFACIAAAVGRTQRQVLQSLRHLLREGVIARIGAVATPAVFGASTLAALSVPAEQIDAIAGYISLMPEVNHNYGRDHHYNLWFVLAAASRAHIDAALARIEEATGFAPLDLPMLEGFSAEAASRGASPRPGMSLEPRQWRLLAALEQGLPLVPRPFARLGMRAGMHEREVIEQLRAWLTSGALRRLGIVLRQPETGFACRAMCVWDVPDERAAELGRRIATQAGASLCFRRERVPEVWPFNLYCVIQGKDRGQVQTRLAALIREAGLEAFASSVLFSTRRYKQCGSRYLDRC